MDFVRDFRVDWGEPIIVKRPPSIASDLTTTGQWAVVVRRIMNGTGVLKVYLIQSKKYSYQLQRLHSGYRSKEIYVIEFSDDVWCNKNLS